MSDIIKLLPDAVANQIAAGEVVQRPASAVKELLENSIDSGADKITLIIKDGGISLMQVIDNGCGMSETDARMCWERHATSKIRTAQDIYALRTFGFRGEALASIAAVAQVELKTRRAEDDVAVFIRIEASDVKEQGIDAGPVGTSIAIKNLFYNIPARRNFLKSISVETRHIIDEVQRQALAHPEIEFVMLNNGAEAMSLKPADTEQRIKDVLNIKKPLLPVHEETEIIGIQGFVGSPETARRTRGDQYFFVNGRFIRSAYFNHAVQAAFEGLIDPGSFPLFVLYLSIDPSKVDVNVHPTKTEVKFEDERHIYNIIKAAIRRAVGSYIAEPDSELFGMGGIEDFLKASVNNSDKQNIVTNHDFAQGQKSRPSYNPFSDDLVKRQERQDWTKILGPVESSLPSERNEVVVNQELNLERKTSHEVQDIFQLAGHYIVARVDDTLYVIDPRAAHEAVLYARFRIRLEKHAGLSQQLLFPRTIELSQGRIHTLLEILPEFQALGFDINHFGGNSVIVNGLPAELQNTDETAVIEKMLEDFESTQGELKLHTHDSLARAMARQTAVQSGTRMLVESMKTLVEQLFTLDSPWYTADKKPVMVKIGIELLFDLFRKQKR